MKTILITGASSGIGRNTAIYLLNKGFKVVAAARSLEKMNDLKKLGCITVHMDVSSSDSIKEAFTQIQTEVETIDILINNAGYTQNGFLEELPIDKLRYQFEVNVFGLLNVTQMVLPMMRQQKKGLIINIGSAGGDFTSAGSSAYASSKHALESITDGLRQEVSHFGIDVVIIKPGGVETDFIHNSSPLFPDPIPNSPYLKMRENFLRTLNSILDSKNSSFPILKPSEVTDAIYSNILKPRTRVRVGRTAKMIPLIKLILSDKAFDKMIMTQLGLLK
ncbi:MAG TPA: SDR family NAD(P)-dependent oxidoreductase [Cytophagaceae bacterium]|jgi:short-subunit dehydrogenase